MKPLTRLILLVMAATHAVAQQPTEPPAPAATQATLREYLQLQQDLLTAFAGKDYPQAAVLCRKSIKLAPNRPEGHYNLACALARQGETDAALKALHEAVTCGWLDSHHMLNDEDLTSLLDDPAFAVLTAGIQKREEAAFRGADMPGIRTEAGRPAEGLRYRLRMDPAADQARPNRLIVWLHPSGGAMNEAAEAMAPLFIEHGYALLVFTQKNFAGWSAADIPAMTKSLAAVDLIEGVDASRPVLMGYSAGGQMALMLWLQNPSAFAGLVLDAAYPIDTSRSQPGEVVTLDLSEKHPLPDIPMFVLVGEQDGGAAVWKRVEDDWREAGVELTIEYVPGKGHTWLFGTDQSAALGKWLAALKPPTADATTP